MKVLKGQEGRAPPSPAWEANEELATKALVSMVKVCVREAGLRLPRSSGKARTLLMVGCAATVQMAVRRPWKLLDPSEVVSWGWQGEEESQGWRGSSGR